MFDFFTALLERPFKNGTTLLNRFEITHFVGKGSYGMVYLALDCDQSKPVIIKQNRKRKGKNTKVMLEKEAGTLQMLDHSSIPKHIHFFEAGPHSLLVMDYVKGTNFEDLVMNEGHVYTEEESLEILLKLIDVVKYLHKNSIIHRDLRLPNIIMHNDQLSIIDFGLAVSHDNATQAAADDVPYDKHFIREISFQSDFYALGHFLLFLLYSSFEPHTRKEQSWEQELVISTDTKKLLKKLLRLEGSYQHIGEIEKDIVRCLSPDTLKH